MLVFVPGMDGSSVRLSSPWHQFRAFSELKNESRGGYLQGEITVPDHVSRIRISLATHSLTPEPHVNLLFVTPSVKLRGVHCQELKPSDHEIVLKKVNNAFELEQPSYWPVHQPILGPGFWTNGKLILGKNALQLTICKAGQKGQSKTSVNEMVKFLRLGQFSGDLEKARLKIIFGNNPPVYSDVILDKIKFLMKIDSIPTQGICVHDTDQKVTVYFNKSVKITQDKCLKLILFRDILSEDIESKTFRIISDNVVEFKVNASRFGICAKTYVLVTIDDQDISSDSLYDEISDDLTIKIAKHDPEHLCFCKVYGAHDFKPTNLKTEARHRRRMNPYDHQSRSLDSNQPSASGRLRERAVSHAAPSQRQLPPSTSGLSAGLSQRPVPYAVYRLPSLQLFRSPVPSQRINQTQMLRTQPTHQSLENPFHSILRSSIPLTSAQPQRPTQPLQAYPQSAQVSPWSQPLSQQPTQPQYQHSHWVQPQNPIAYPSTTQPQLPQRPSANLDTYRQPQLPIQASFVRPQLSIPSSGFSRRPEGHFGPISATVPSRIFQDSYSDSDRESQVDEVRREPQGSTRQSPEPPSITESNTRTVSAVRAVSPDEGDIVASISALRVVEENDLEVRHVRYASQSSESDDDNSDSDNENNEYLVESSHSDTSDEIENELDGSDQDDQDDDRHYDQSFEDEQQQDDFAEDQIERNEQDFDYQEYQADYQGDENQVYEYDQSYENEVYECDQSNGNEGYECDQNDGNEEYECDQNDGNEEYECEENDYDDYNDYGDYDDYNDYDGDCDYGSD